MSNNNLLVNSVNKLFEITRKAEEARVILNQAMAPLPDVAAEIPAPLDGKLALSYARLMQVRDILKSIVEE